jgi:HTH-type transcriptional regulator/antitoxin HigA
MNTMKNSNSIVPGHATHPGEILKDELDARNISQSDFAKKIGYQKSQLNEIINGKRGINADLALLLAEALKVDAEYWMNAQKTYELDLAKIDKKNQSRLEAIAQWQMLEGFVPIKYFKSQEVISGDPLEDIPVIKQIYKVNNFEELAGVYTSKNYQRFRKSDKLNTDKINLIGWVKLVEYKAEKLTAPKFDHSKKSDLISELNKIICKNKNLKVKVAEVLKESGIKIVYQEKYEKTPVDGVSFWSHGNPAIGMTLRYNRVDNFAFTLYHELGHIYLHLLNDNQAEFIDLDKNDVDYKNSKEEKEADDFASNHLIDKKSWQEFYHSPSVKNDRTITQFAKAHKIHPSIVKGRLCHETGNYAWKTRIDSTIK